MLQYMIRDLYSVSETVTIFWDIYALIGQNSETVPHKRSQSSYLKSTYDGFLFSAIACYSSFTELILTSKMIQ